MCDGENDIPLIELDDRLLVVVKGADTPEILLNKADLIIRTKKEVIDFLTYIANYNVL